MHGPTLVLLLLGASVVRAYPAAPKVAQNRILSPAHVTNTAGRDPHAAPVKRQIHNADYHANAPPPPGQANPTPAPASKPASTQDSPVAAAAPAPSQAPAAAKNTRAEPAAEPRAFGPGPVVRPSNPSPCDNSSEKRAHRATHHSGPGLANVPVGYEKDHQQHDRAWPGWGRRAAEELADAHNPALDHDMIARWSEEEVARMQAWSRAHLD